MRAEPADLGLGNNSLIDATTQHLVRGNSKRFLANESHSDEEVTLDVAKGFGADSLIVWEGHGICTNGLGPVLLLSQKAEWTWWKELVDEDYTEKRIVVSGDRIAVTSLFFEKYYQRGDLQDSIIYLGSCQSLKSDKLAATLVDKGASLVIGNTDTVTTVYQFEMRDSILCDMATYRMPVSEALQCAREIYGEEDPWRQDGVHTQVAYYPTDAGSVTLYGKGEKELSRDGAPPQRTNYEYFAHQFIYDMYNDWTFSAGHNVDNTNPFPGRCLKYIDGDSKLYGEFIESGVSMTAEYYKEAAACVMGELETRMVSDKVCRVSIPYVVTQNTVDQQMYDQMLQNVGTDVWDVTMNGACKATALERAALVDDSQYTVHFSTADLVLPEALRGEVKPVVDADSGAAETVHHGGLQLLIWDPDTSWLDQARESGEPTDNADVDTQTLSDGTELIFGVANDGYCYVEIISPQGHRGILWSRAYNDFVADMLGNPPAVDSCRQLQAAAAGMSPDEDAYDIVMAFLRVCAEQVTFTGDASADEQASSEVVLGKTPEGTYLLAGTVRVHEENFIYGDNPGYVDVVSLVLDEQVPYQYEYKGTVDAIAQEVALETERDDSYGTWAQYDGQHIAIECDELRGVYHDNANLNVDTMAMGTISLVSVG